MGQTNIRTNKITVLLNAPYRTRRGVHNNVAKLEIISTLLRQIGIPPPTVVPWREALYKDWQSYRRVGVF